MIKQTLLLAAAMFCSASASAGYVQYNLSGPLSGYIVQRDGDQSIRYFSLDLSLTSASGDEYLQLLTPFQHGEGRTDLDATTTHFKKNGPSNFRVVSDFGGDQTTDLKVTFSAGANGAFNYVADYKNWMFFVPNGISFAGTHTGSASPGTVDPELVAALDAGGGYYYNVDGGVPTYVEPNAVPEPGSLALIGIGAIALVRRRNRK